MRSITITCGTVICILLNDATATAQNSAEVATRMRPLGSPSAVDRYQPMQNRVMPPRNSDSLQQVMWMQSSDGSPMTMPSLPPSPANSGLPMPGFSMPGSPTAPPPAAAPNMSIPGTGYSVPAPNSLPAATAVDHGDTDRTFAKQFAARGATIINGPSFKRGFVAIQRRAPHQSQM